VFFFEKKNQKTFMTQEDSWIKVFCFFFSKKKTLPSFSLLLP